MCKQIVIDCSQVSGFELDTSLSLPTYCYLGANLSQARTGSGTFGNLPSL